MKVTPHGKWSLVSVAGYGCQPPCRGQGRVVETGPDVDGCIQFGAEVIFLDIQCGVLIVDCGTVLVHEDYIVATVGHGGCCQ